MSIAVPGDGPSSTRDQRLDVFRGLALVTIFINHVPGTVYEVLTSRNFGFSDAAEGFVIMSGIAAGLAYGRAMAPGRAFEGMIRCWRRAFTLYWVHIVTTMMAVAISAGAARFFGVHEMIEINNVQIFFDDLIGVLIGLPLLTHQLGYFNILPLYAVLLIATPGLILLARVSPALLFGLSLALWFLTGLFRLNIPNYPTSGGWFFDPFAWQLIFVVGLLTGLALKEGHRLVAPRRWLFWLAVGFLLFALVWTQVDPVRDAGRAGLGVLRDLGVPFQLVSFDKTFLALPRLLHVLALFYVISMLPWLKEFVAKSWAAPFALMGRHGLPVFALGSVLSILCQALKKGTEAGVALDGVILLTGIVAQILFAHLFELRREAAARKRDA